MNFLVGCEKGKSENLFCMKKFLLKFDGFKNSSHKGVCERFLVTKLNFQKKNEFIENLKNLIALKRFFFNTLNGKTGQEFSQLLINFKLREIIFNPFSSIKHYPKRIF